MSYVIPVLSPDPGTGLRATRSVPVLPVSAPTLRGTTVSLSDLTYRESTPSPSVRLTDPRGYGEGRVTPPGDDGSRKVTNGSRPFMSVRRGPSRRGPQAVEPVTPVRGRVEEEDR